MKVSANGWPSCTSLLVTSKVPTAGSNEYGSGVGGRSRDTFTLLGSPDRDAPESILYRPEQQNPSPPAPAGTQNGRNHDHQLDQKLILLVRRAGRGRSSRCSVKARPAQLAGPGRHRLITETADRRWTTTGPTERTAARTLMKGFSKRFFRRRGR